MKPVLIGWIMLSLLAPVGASAQVYDNQTGARAPARETVRERNRRQLREDLGRGRLTRDENRLIELRRLQDRRVVRDRSGAGNSAPANGNRQTPGTVRQQ